MQFVGGCHTVSAACVKRHEFLNKSPLLLTTLIPYTTHLKVQIPTQSSKSLSHSHVAENLLIHPHCYEKEIKMGGIKPKFTLFYFLNNVFGLTTIHHVNKENKNVSEGVFTFGRFGLF